MPESHAWMHNLHKCLNAQFAQQLYREINWQGRKLQISETDIVHFHEYPSTGILGIERKYIAWFDPESCKKCLFIGPFCTESYHRSHPHNQYSANAATFVFLSADWQSLKASHRWQFKSFLSDGTAGVHFYSCSMVMVWMHSVSKKKKMLELNLEEISSGWMSLTIWKFEIQTSFSHCK